MLSHCVDGRRIFQFQPKSFLRPLKSLSRWRDEKFTEGEKNVYFSVFVLRFAYFSNSIKSLRRLSILFFHGPFRSSVYVVFFPALRDERNSNETRGNFHTNRSWAEEIHNKLFFSSLSLKIVLKSPLQSFHVPELFSRPTDFRQIKVLHSGCIFSLFTSPRSESVNEMMVESCTLDNTGKVLLSSAFVPFIFLFVLTYDCGGGSKEWTVGAHEKQQHWEKVLNGKVVIPSHNFSVKSSTLVLLQNCECAAHTIYRLTHALSN